MPLGSRHVVTGRLRRAGDLWALDVDGGGTWRIDGGVQFDRWAGQRVEVDGERVGFDLLEVTRVTPAGSS